MAACGRRAPPAHSRYPRPVLCYSTRARYRGAEEEAMSETITYVVSGMSCGHCEAAVTEELSGVEGVAQVEVDLASKLVTVHGQRLDDAALRAAIEDAGYEAER